MKTIVLSGTVTAAQTLSYLHLPFEVPSNTVRLDVHYDYSAAISADPTVSGGNTVDIGIFDVRGHDFMTGGFRGWSGSARRMFYIALEDATPGYLPGPIQSGIWFICLGLYKVAEQGCDYRVTITLTAADEVVESNFPELLPLHHDSFPTKPTGWYKGELHCHTYHSDGDSDPLAVVRKAEALGLDFLAITDHNVQSQLAALKSIDTSLMLIPGYEVTTYKGHWNIWGGGEWIDFRILTADKLRTAMQAARDAGYVVSCNHPRTYGPPWEFTEVDLYECIEVWNGPWEIFNHEALAFWEARLREGRQITAVGGSDAHFHHREHITCLGQPTTYIYCGGSPSPAALLANLRAGHAFITSAPDGAQLYLQSSDTIMGDTVSAYSELSIQIRAVDASGLLLQVIGSDGVLVEQPIEKDDEAHTFTLAADNPLYVRAQLIEAQYGRVAALTNPLYIR
jgi:predicted metal-dependent phosphoesterase TrpH